MTDMKTLINLTIAKNTETSDSDNYMYGLDQSNPSIPTIISISTDDKEEVMKLLSLAGVNSTYTQQPDKTVTTFVPDEEEVSIDSDTDYDEEEVNSSDTSDSPEAISAIIPLYDTEEEVGEGKKFKRDLSTMRTYASLPPAKEYNPNWKKELEAAREKKREKSTVGESTAQYISRLAGLGSKTTLDEARLLEYNSMNEKLLNILHNLGIKMIDAASKIGSYKGQAEDSEKFSELNKLSRIGEMLVGLGEPFSTPLQKFDREDLEFIANKLGVPFHKFARIARLRESTINLRPYQGVGNSKPLSKRVGNADQALVNNTGDNPVQDKNEPRTVGFKSIKESIDALSKAGMSSINEDSSVVVFEINDAALYDAILDKFGNVISWNSDDQMVAPRGYWGAIQETAAEMGSEVAEITVGEGNSHDDLRAMKSDHDTLMCKNIADAKKQHIVSEDASEMKYMAQAITELPEDGTHTYDNIITLLFATDCTGSHVTERDIENALEHKDYKTIQQIRQILKGDIHEDENVCEDEVCEDELEEKAPPSPEIEHWIKANKARFKKEYGEKGEGILYATAWKKYNESVEDLSAALMEQYNKFSV